LLAQKGATNQRLLSQLVGEQKGHPECFRDPILPPTYPARPSLGKEAYAFFLAGATHCALFADNQYLKVA